MGSISIFHLVVVFASAVILTQAMPPREDIDRLINRLQQHELKEAAHYNEIGHNLRNLDALGGRNLLRETRPESLQYTGDKSAHGFGNQKRMRPDILSGYQLYYRPGVASSMKRYNFDEIDHPGFPGFEKKNFDEIDHAGFGGFEKKNFDEIDHAGFGGFQKKNFDEIDHMAFPGFQKKNFDEIDRMGFPGFQKKNFDEIDHEGFEFQKRNFDEIDRYGFPGFSKRAHV